MIYKLLHIYLPQCLLVRDLAQRQTTRFLHPYTVIFRQSTAVLYCTDKKRGRLPE